MVVQVQLQMVVMVQLTLAVAVAELVEMVILMVALVVQD